MEIQASSSAEWEQAQISPTENHVSLAFDVLIAGNVGSDTHEKLAQFFEKIALPDLIASTGNEVETATEFQIQTSSEIQSQWFVDAAGFHNRIEMLVSLNADQPMEPLTALSHARADIANSIADHLFSCLQNI